MIKTQRMLMVGSIFSRSLKLWKARIFSEPTSWLKTSDSQPKAAFLEAESIDNGDGI
jgi:hypothetical protein